MTRYFFHFTSDKRVVKDTEGVCLSEFEVLPHAAKFAADIVTDRTEARATRLRRSMCSVLKPSPQDGSGELSH